MLLSVIKTGGLKMMAHLGFWGDGGVSCDQGGDESSEEGFSASSGVVDELEEAEVGR